MFDYIKVYCSAIKIKENMNKKMHSLKRLQNCFFYILKLAYTIITKSISQIKIYDGINLTMSIARSMQRLIKHSSNYSAFKKV